MRCYPDRITTRRILAEDRLSTLARLKDEALCRLTTLKHADDLQEPHPKAFRAGAAS